MSIVLNKIVANAGIVSVGHRDPHNKWVFVEGTTSSAPKTEAETKKIHEIFTQALDLLSTSEEPEVKIMFGDKTLVIQKNEDHVLGIVVCKGHPVVKSLQRMFRKTFSRFEKMAVPVSTTVAPANSGENISDNFRPAVVDPSVDKSKGGTTLLN
jgi:hypothetical protein